MPITRDQTYYRVSLGASYAYPIVLIHGAGGSSLSWTPSVRNIPFQTIYTVDLDGHGSSPLSSLSRVEHYADQIARFLDALKIYKVILAGHSMGGAVAMTVASREPDRVIGLGLIATAARLRLPKDIFELTPHPETYIELVDRLISRSFSPTEARRTTNLVKKQLVGQRQAILTNDLLACHTFDFNNDLATIEQPTMILCGDNDQMTPLRESIHLNNTLPTSEIRILPGKGHMLPIEAPGAIVSGLKSLTDRVIARTT